MDIDKIAKIALGSSDSDFPMYIIDPKKAQENYRIFQEYFPGCPVHFALKSNSDIEILKSLNEIDAKFEIASMGELNRLLSVGASPDKIIFSNPCKSSAEISEIYSNGIRYFAFENLEDLKKLVQLAPEAQFALRINLHEHDSSAINYGATLEYVEKVIAPDKEMCSRISGLAFYGSHDLGLEVCGKIISNCLKNIKFVNVGGGFMYPELLQDFSDGRKTWRFDFFPEKINQFREKHGVAFMFEPGAAIVSSACQGVSRVKYVNEMAGEIYYHVDLGPSLGLKGKIPEVYFILSSNGREMLEKGFIADPTCAKNIIYQIGKHRKMQEGDIIIFPDIGMYSLVHISNFHLLKKPKFVYLK